MSDSTDRDGDLAATSPEPVFQSPPKHGRRRVVATIVGGALLFAGGAGTGAVVSGAVGSSSASANTVAGPGGQSGTGMQPPGQSGTSGQVGTAPTGAPTAGASGS
jgi:hypothetical protein